MTGRSTYNFVGINKRIHGLILPLYYKTETTSYLRWVLFAKGECWWSLPVKGKLEQAQRLPFVQEDRYGLGSLIIVLSTPTKVYSLTANALMGVVNENDSKLSDQARKDCTQPGELWAELQEVAPVKATWEVATAKIDEEWSEVSLMILVLCLHSLCNSYLYLKTPLAFTLKQRCVNISYLQEVLVRLELECKNGGNGVDAEDLRQALESYAVYTPKPYVNSQQEKLVLPAPLVTRSKPQLTLSVNYLSGKCDKIIGVAVDAIRKDATDKSKPLEEFKPAWKPSGVRVDFAPRKKPRNPSKSPPPATATRSTAKPSSNKKKRGSSATVASTPSSKKKKQQLESPVEAIPPSDDEEDQRQSPPVASPKKTSKLKSKSKPQAVTKTKTTATGKKTKKRQSRDGVAKTVNFSPEPQNQFGGVNGGEGAAAAAPGDDDVQQEAGEYHNIQQWLAGVQQREKQLVSEVQKLRAEKEQKQVFVANMNPFMSNDPQLYFEAVDLMLMSFYQSNRAAISGKSRFELIHIMEPSVQAEFHRHLFTNNPSM